MQIHLLQAVLCIYTLYILYTNVLFAGPKLLHVHEFAELAVKYKYNILCIVKKL